MTRHCGCVCAGGEVCPTKITAVEACPIVFAPHFKNTEKQKKDVHKGYAIQRVRNGYASVF